jgi:hypothetical protein
VQGVGQDKGSHTSSTHSRPGLWQETARADACVSWKVSVAGGV